MTEQRANIYHCSLMFFYKTYLNLKAYFRGGLFPVSIFSKILDYVVSIEIIVPFPFLSNMLSYAYAYYYDINTGMHRISKKYWHK